MTERRRLLSALGSLELLKAYWRVAYRALRGGPMKRTVTATVERISTGRVLYQIVILHDNGTRELAAANNVMSGDLRDLMLNGVAPQMEPFGIAGLKRATLTFEYDDSSGA